MKIRTTDSLGFSILETAMLSLVLLGMVLAGLEVVDLMLGQRTLAQQLEAAMAENSQAALRVSDIDEGGFAVDIVALEWYFSAVAADISANLKNEQFLLQGYWGELQIDPATGEARGYRAAPLDTMRSFGSLRVDEGSLAAEDIARIFEREAVKEVHGRSIFALPLPSFAKSTREAREFAPRALLVAARVFVNRDTAWGEPYLHSSNARVLRAEL